MAPHFPAAQVRQLRGHDDDVSVVPGGDQESWPRVCTAHDEPRNRTVAILSTSSVGRESISAELGLYDDLYSKIPPDDYFGELSQRFGCRAQGPPHFSGSALIVKDLGQLRNEGLLGWKYDGATSFWSYNGVIHMWRKIRHLLRPTELTLEGSLLARVCPQVWELG